MQQNKHTHEKGYIHTHVFKYRLGQVPPRHQWAKREVKGGMEKDVSFEIKIPEYLMDAIDYYIQFTHYWEGRPYAESAINAFIVRMIRAYMESETDEIPLAFDNIRDELSEMLRMKT